MGQFINFTELYNAGGSFAKQEITAVTDNGVTTTTIYGGYAPSASPVAATDALSNWVVRRMVVVDNGTVQTVECTWAKGSWNDRANLEYTYYKP